MTVVHIKEDTKLNKIRVKEMPKKCPKCGEPNSLDFDPDFKIWRCIWVSCSYEEREIREFSKNEMGRVVPDLPLVFLSNDFVKNQLSFFELSQKKSKIPFEIDIQCPFCKNGVLTLNMLKKNICETHVVHTGDSYRFNCSNHKECASMFTYTNTWMHC